MLRTNQNSWVTLAGWKKSSPPLDLAKNSYCRLFSLAKKSIASFSFLRKIVSALFFPPRPRPLFSCVCPLPIIPARVSYKFWPFPIVYTCPPVGISIRPFCDCANKTRISFPIIGVIDFGCPVQELVWSLQHFKGITSSQEPVLMKWYCINFDQVKIWQCLPSRSGQARYYTIKTE